MSSGSKKIVLGKDELRKLMKEKTGAANSDNQKKVESPFAKYNAVGQLWCSLCNCPVKTNILWNAHIQGRTHKENVAKLKAEEDASRIATVNVPPVDRTVLKRKSSHLEGSSGSEPKFAKVEVPSQSSNGFQSSSANASSNKSAGAERSGGLALQYDSDSEEDMEQEEAVSSDRLPVALPSSAINHLPSDFFDNPLPQTVSSSSEPIESTPASIAEKLPEGFFDDPKMDAKVRQVPYKDKLDEEWELFQKTMKEETLVSEAIVEEDDELREAERNIEEIDDQLNRWSRVTDLLKKRDQCLTDVTENIQQTTQQRDSGLSDDSDDEFDAFSNWRAGGK